MADSPYNFVLSRQNNDGSWTDLKIASFYQSGVWNDFYVDVPQPGYHLYRLTINDGAGTTDRATFVAMALKK